jgi:UDP-N-acetylmuramate--alanine ligase
MLAELMRMQVDGRGRRHPRQDHHDLDDRGDARRRRDRPDGDQRRIINAYGSNARLGSSDWMVVEADESDGSFLRLDGTIAVVTNIDPEHLEHYGSFDEGQGRLRRVRRERALLRRSRCCASTIPRCRTIMSRIRDRRVVTYGFLRAGRRARRQCRPVPGGSRFDVSCAARRRAADDRGRRAADAGPAQCPERARRDRGRARARHGRRDIVARGFEKFDGVKRRFTKVGEIDGAIDHRRLCPPPGRDPRGALRAREGAQGRVIAVVQPHRYTRLRDLMDDFQNAFNDADVVFVAPVYPAGEEPIEGVDAEALVEGLRARGHRMVKIAVARPADLCLRSLRDLAAEGDMIICMGAGDITKWAAGLADGIAQGEGGENDEPRRRPCREVRAS